MTYECKRCFYKTKLKTDMKRHLNKKIKCPRILESYKYNEKDLEELSLIFENNESNLITTKELYCLSEDIIKNSNNKDDALLYVSHHKLTKCLFCNAEYSRFYDLKRHIKNTCKYFNKNNKNEIIDSDKSNNVKFQNNIQQNITNNNQQITNNITINVYNSTNNNQNGNIVILPFDQNWDVSKIDEKQKLILFLEDRKYSKTMEEILQNEKNLNIILDKDSDLGLIYKNDVEKFINMKSNDIIDKAMNKIYNHLIDFYDEMKDKGYTLTELDSHKELIEKKFEEFNCNKDKKTKEYVKNILFDIFDKNKDKVIERFIQFNSKEQDNDQSQNSDELENIDLTHIIENNKNNNDNDNLW
jgi:hypothetical protein